MKAIPEKNTVVRSQRNSNIEALRIISMLLIIAFHAARTGYNSTSAGLAVYTGGQILGSWGILGVDLFLIISAWYLSVQQFRVKKVVDIVFQTFTWMFVFFVLSVLYELGQGHSAAETAAKLGSGLYSALEQPFFASCYWFVTSYFFLLLLSPLLNRLLHKASRQLVKKVLSILAFVPVYSQFNTSVVGDIVYFAYVYLLIGYVRKYGSALLKRAAKPISFLSLAVIIIASRLLLYFLGDSPTAAVVRAVIGCTVGKTGRHAIVMLIEALLIFFWVIKLPPRCSRLLNGVAGCTLGVYMFHENHFLSFPNVVETVFYRAAEWGFIGTNWLFPAQYLAVTAVVFCVGAAIEYLRQKVIQKPFMEHVGKKYSDKFKEIDGWFNTL